MTEPWTEFVRVHPLWQHVLQALQRIADALDRAYPPAPSHPRVDELFDDPKVDPVAFVMDLWGETRTDAEQIVATTVTQEIDPEVKREVPLWWMRNN